MIKVFEGENSFLSKKKLDCTVKEYQDKNPQICCKIIDAEKTSISKIYEEYETQDMFAQEKLIVLKRLLLNKECKELVERIVSTYEQAKKTHLIIWEDRNIPKNTRYYKSFNEIKALESFPKFNKPTFKKWAKEEIEEHYLKIDNKTLNVFAETVNYDPQILQNEVEKIKLQGKSEITKEIIEKNMEDTYTNSIWEFLDSINQKNNMSANTKILLNLLKNGLHPHYLMIMMARNIKHIMMIIKMTEDQKSDKEMASILKIPPFTLPRLKKIAKESDYEKLLKIYQKIYNLNYETKVGGIDPELGLILLVTRLN